MAAPWKLPLNLALLLHVLILSGAILLPQYLPQKYILPEALTVTLVSSAPAPAPAVAIAPPKSVPQKPAATIKIPKLQQAKSRKIAPIATPVTPPPAVEPVKTRAISIKPLKRKIKKKIPASTSVANNRQRKDAQLQKARLEQQRQYLLQEARRQEKLAAAEEAAANDAVKALRQMLRTDAAIPSPSPSVSSKPSPGSSGNIITDQYNAAINGILMENWALPDIKPWSSDLLAIVIIDIAKNGRIIRHSFEKRSGDRVFDQFVSRTIQESNPLLPIPAAMRTTQYSIGLRFRPGQIQ